MSDFEQSYLGQLRTLVGNRRLITPGARAVVRDASGRVLLVRRRDTGNWGMPAGSLEPGESILDCLRREVREETGLQVLGATPIAIYSEPRFWFTNAHGGEHQMLAVVFLVEKWAGELLASTDETIAAAFFAPDELPDLPGVYRETLDDLRRYDGRLILK